MMSSDTSNSVTTSERKRRKSCADAALFHLRVAREALVGLDADTAGIDSLLDDAAEAAAYYADDAA